MMRWQDRRVWTAAVVGLVLGAAPAWGQYELGDGRALDRNPRRGSGGVNPQRRANTAGRYADAIVTGNVGGLARFRGDIDYGAVGEFSAETGADDTFLFRLQSMPPYALTPFQQRQAGQLPRVGRPPANPLIQPQAAGNVLLRAGSGVRAGQLTGGYEVYAPIGGARRDDTVIVPMYGAEDRAIPSLDRPTPPLTAEQLLGLEATEDGRLLEVTASPLLGLRRQVIGTLQRRTMETEEQADQPQRRTPSQEGEQPAEEPSAGQAAAAARRVEGSVERSIVEAQRVGEGPADRAITADRGPGEEMPTDELARVPGGGGEAGAAAAAGSEAYAELLERIGAASGDADVPALRRSIEQIREALERTRRGEGLDEPAAAIESAREAAGRLSYDLPAVQSLAGSRPSAFNRLMGRAVREMAAGRFFDAERSYREALAWRGDDPLARLGGAQAQLAAGLHASAARTLRYILTYHPELAAMRFAPPLLGGEQRLAEVRRQLELAMREPDRPEAALPLAYLAYQQGRMEEARAALVRMMQQDARDPLPRLLHWVWLPNEPLPTAAPPSEERQPGDAPSSSR